MKYRIRTARRIPTIRRSSTCAHIGCEHTATDRRRGVALCMDHFFWALQVEQQAAAVCAKMSA